MGDPGTADGGDYLQGELGNDTLSGGAGLDLYEAAEGDDTVDAREPADGPAVWAESIFCGVGVDTALLDGDDLVDRCETIERSGRPATEFVRPGASLPAPPSPLPQSPNQAELELVLDEPAVTLDDGLLIALTAVVAAAAPAGAHRTWQATEAITPPGGLAESGDVVVTPQGDVIASIGERPSWSSDGQSVLVLKPAGAPLVRIPLGAGRPAQLAVDAAGNTVA